MVLTEYFVLKIMRNMTVLKTLGKYLPKYTWQRNSVVDNFKRFWAVFRMTYIQKSEFFRFHRGVLKNNDAFPVSIYLFNVKNGNTRAKCDICSKLNIKTPERRQWRRSGVFNVNFEQISDLVLVFLLLTLRR